MSNDKRNQTSGTPSSPRINTSNVLTTLQASVKSGEYQQKYSSMVFKNQASNYTPSKYTQNPINFFKGQQQRTQHNAKFLGNFNNKILGPIGSVFSYQDQVKNSKAQTDLGKKVSGVLSSVVSLKMNPMVAFVDMASGGNLSNFTNKTIDQGVVQGEKFINHYSNMDFETGREQYQNFKDFDQL